MTTDPSSDVVERLRAATADDWTLRMPNGGLHLHCDIRDAIATIERLSAELERLTVALDKIDVGDFSCARHQRFKVAQSIARAALSNTADTRA